MKHTKASKTHKKKSDRKKSRKSSKPKTASIKKSISFVYMKRSKASGGMGMSELQFMAKSRGIPFGGLSKEKLIHKINNYS